LKTYHNISSFEVPEETILTIGSYDGVHLGHQKILSTIIEKAKATGKTSVLLTFSPHPRYVIPAPKKVAFGLLSTDSEKESLLESLGLDYLIVQDFTLNWANREPEAYVKKSLIEGINPKEIVVGFDHRFGKARKGDITLLQAMCKEHNISVTEIDKQLLEEDKISSTRARILLDKGDVHKVKDVLGRPYSIQGTVVEGFKVGRSIGFPTANIEPNSPQKLIPADGAYACKITVDGQIHNAMMNIGLRPTLSSVSKRSIEVHIFNFAKDIYNKEVYIQFEHRIRDEKKFRSLEELSAQLLKDREAATKLLM